MANTNEATALTDLLKACADGDSSAFDQLVPKVYEHLRRIARAQLNRRPQNTLDTSGLVHEAYMKLALQPERQWRSRGHFFTAAAQAMRHILVDAARRRLSKKRGSGENAKPLSEDIAIDQAHALDVLSVHQALNRLRDVDPRLALTVECRFFAGLSGEETAIALGVSERTAHRFWIRAKAWLEVFMKEEGQSSEDSNKPEDLRKAEQKRSVDLDR